MALADDYFAATLVNGYIKGLPAPVATVRKLTCTDELRQRFVKVCFIYCLVGVNFVLYSRFQSGL